MGSLQGNRCLVTMKRVMNVSRFASTISGTIDPNEIATFQRLSHEWMDENGPFKALHSYNRLRLPWIVNTLGKVGFYL